MVDVFKRYYVGTEDKYNRKISISGLIKGAGWLNILGMSVAFAAIYIIQVQVNYDLGYNK